MGSRSSDDERQINRWKRIVSKFKGKLINMFKDVNSIFDDYSISPKIRQILLHWGFKLVEKIYKFFASKIYFFLNSIKMSYCQLSKRNIVK